jgi:hypothetical protein
MLLPSGETLPLRRAVACGPIGSAKIQEEEWRLVAHSRGYEVSTLGRVRRAGRMLNPCPNTDGYPIVDVWFEDKTHKRRGVHALVCEAFIGPRPAGHECCHNNGIRHDNRLANLRYATHAENELDKLQHGTRARGTSHPSAKLSYEKAAEIRRLHAEGETIYALAKKFGVHKSTLQSLVKGITWVRPEQTAYNPASDLTETTRVSCLERARVGSPVEPLAPGTDIVCPPPVSGALINTPVHGETYAG